MPYRDAVLELPQPGQGVVPVDRVAAIVLDQELAGFGGSYPTAVPVEQGCVELLLQQGDLAAHHRRVHAERVGRGAHGAVTRSLEQIAQPVLVDCIDHAQVLPMRQHSGNRAADAQVPPGSVGLPGGIRTKDRDMAVVGVVGLGNMGAAWRSRWRAPGMKCLGPMPRRRPAALLHRRASRFSKASDHSAPAPIC